MRGLLQAFVAAALALAGLTSAAAARDSDEQRVRGYLEHGMQRHAALGFVADTMVPDLLTPLHLDRPYLWSVYLVEGTTYRIYGACDDDCADLDMEVYGNDGNLADRDTARDDTPYVQITPPRSGRVYVRLWLYACRAERCMVTARVVSGGVAAPREPATVAASPPADANASGKPD